MLGPSINNDTRFPCCIHPYYYIVQSVSVAHSLNTTLCMPYTYTLSTQVLEYDEMALAAATHPKCV